MISRLRKRIILGSVAALLSIGGGLVLAQDTPATPPADAPPEEHAAPPAEAPAEVDVPMRKRANISTGDMVNQAQGYLRKMQDSLRRVVELQEVARKQKDVIKLNCVNDKLLQVKQLLNIGETANTNMQESIARRDEDGRYHEFGRITIANQQVQVLSTEAENCIGEDLSFLGPTEVTVDAPEQPDDPTADPTPEFPEVEPPPVASPFL